jgi:hypothetical protein
MPMKITVLWNVTPCSWVNCYQYFRGSLAVTYQTTLRYIPEDNDLQTDLRCVYEILRMSIHDPNRQRCRMS